MKTNVTSFKKIYSNRSGWVVFLIAYVVIVLVWSFNVSASGSHNGDDDDVGFNCGAGGILSHDDFLAARAGNLISVAGFTVDEQAHTVTAKVMNSTNCKVPISFSSYKLTEPFDAGNLSSQEFIGDDHEDIAPNYWAELTVPLASCATQYDVWYGDAPHELQNIVYGPWLLGYSFYKQDTICRHVEPLAVTCSATPTTATVGTSIAWSSLASGGGAPLTYSWSGTNGLSGNLSSVNKIYTSSGTKRGTITVTDASGTEEEAECEVQIRDEEVSIPACPIPSAPGRIIVTFPTTRKIVSGGSVEQAMNGPVTASIPAGTYKVTLASFDGYSGRESITQPREQWFANLFPVASSGSSANGDDSDLGSSSANGDDAESSSVSTIRTGTISDLQDLVRTTLKTEVVNQSLSVPFLIGGVKAVHAAYPDTAFQNSLYPLCAAFDPVATTPPPPPPPPPASFQATCVASPQSIEVGNSVSWSATASGGTGSYTYSWTGSDALSGSTANVSKIYSSAGTKNATVTVTSGSLQATAQCSLSVTTVPTTPPPPPPPPSTTPPPPPPPPSSVCMVNCGGGSLNPPNVYLTKGTSSRGGSTVYLSQTPYSGGRVAGVFLSQLPYTGILADYGSVILFLIGVLFWSAIVAFAIHNNWHRKFIALLRMMNKMDTTASSQRENENEHSRSFVAPTPTFGNPYSSITEERRAPEISEENASPTMEDISVAEEAPLTHQANTISPKEDEPRIVTSPALTSSLKSKTWMKYEPIRHTLPTILLREAQKNKVMISDDGFELITNAGDRKEDESLQILRQLVSVAESMYPREGGWLNLNKTQIQKMLFSTYMSMTALFIDWIVRGEKGSCFAFIRSLKQQGHSVEAFMTQVATMLDGLYRYRIEGDQSNYDSTVDGVLEGVSNAYLQTLIGQIISSLDQGYVSSDVGAKMALVKIFTALGEDPRLEKRTKNETQNGDRPVRIPNEALR